MNYLVREECLMKEIRFHGRGGQGVVKSAQILVETVVEGGLYAHFIPFFGAERKGSPVFGFLRIDDKEIRVKCQVYHPEVLMVFDDTLLNLPQTFLGLVDHGVVIINTEKTVESLPLPEKPMKVFSINATGIALERFKKPIPNTAMLGAFAKATGWVNWQILQEKIRLAFNNDNALAAIDAYENVQLVKQEEF
ncbi:MAG: pyruvate ferredoxin oxidoreductase [Chloroflexi bacterium]|nr:pyruvate ferredoxin oxidoreductase [Chloroflexota bacterium]